MGIKVQCFEKCETKEFSMWMMINVRLIFCLASEVVYIPEFLPCSVPHID